MRVDDTLSGLARQRHQTGGTPDAEGLLARQALEDLAQAVASKNVDSVERAVRDGKALTYNNLVENYPFLQECLGKPLTPFDTPAVVAERQRIVKLGYDLQAQGLGDTSKINTPERNELRQRIVDQLYGSGARCRDRQVYIVTGLPGAGKSSTANQIRSRSGALNIEGDEIRAALPEYQQYHSQYQVNSEKAIIRSAIKERALAAGDNILIDYVPGKLGPDGHGVSGSSGTLRDNLKYYKSQGYTVHLVHIDTAIETVEGRIQKRFVETGRLSDPLADTMVVNIPREDADSVRHDPSLIDTFTRIDNNGSGPVVVEAAAMVGGAEVGRPLELP